MFYLDDLYFLICCVGVIPVCFLKILDCERNDKNKRIAIVNDEPRIKELIRHVGVPFEEAVKYTMVGCIESGKPVTRYGCKTAIGGFNAMGLTTVIDSLTVIKQFVFDEKRITLEHLIEVLKSNWQLDPGLHTEVMKRSRFFGNDDSLSNEMSRRFTRELCLSSEKLRLPNGARPIFGTLSGYNLHYAIFGAQTPATPDGRYDGESFMVGSGQNKGRDREGLTALMNSLAGMDRENIMIGPVVCNMLVDEALIKNNSYFDGFCRTVEPI